MTRRERYLRALRNEPVDALVWAPNFDYWLSVNRAEGTLPERYVGLSRNDIVRAVGGTIWNRASGLRLETDASVRSEVVTSPGLRVETLHTPLGSIRQVHRDSEGPHRAKFLAEHFVKDLESLRTRRYVVEATRCVADYEPTWRALRETGDDGIVLNSFGCVPFIQFAKSDAGYENGFLMWADHREAVDGLVAAWSRLYLDAYRVLADGPADVIATGDNMDGVMISPALFQTYAVPFYREARSIVRAGGKLLEGHWCGRTQTLLPLVPECGLDIVEAIVTRPMADITLPAALDALQGRVVLQGGIPSVLVCRQGGSFDDYARYLRETVLPLRGRRGFVVGLSDNVPPDADFARLEATAALLDCRDV